MALKPRLWEEGQSEIRYERTSTDISQNVVLEAVQCCRMHGLSHQSVDDQGVEGHARQEKKEYKGERERSCTGDHAYV